MKTDSVKRIVISGGFDPIHPGHIAMIESASKYGQVHIVLNSDNWLLRKKKFFFQTWTDRKKILEIYTPHIHEVNDSDDTVCDALQRLQPNYFGNGGDRHRGNIPEYQLCKRLGIEMVFGLGGDKYTSSSVINSRKRVLTEWGWFDVLLETSQLEVLVHNVISSTQKKLFLEKLGRKNFASFFFLDGKQMSVEDLRNNHNMLFETTSVIVEVLPRNLLKL